MAPQPPPASSAQPAPAPAKGKGKKKGKDSDRLSSILQRIADEPGYWPNRNPSLVPSTDDLLAGVVATVVISIIADTVMCIMIMLLSIVNHVVESP